MDDIALDEKLEVIFDNEEMKFNLAKILISIQESDSFEPRTEEELVEFAVNRYLDEYEDYDKNKLTKMTYEVFEILRDEELIEY